ncbi:MAG: hypothetical protein EAZ85_14120 [Bacteroidetes bacterium]|nr:MAG: hypothetical protein EAZ85_14120 [Bacteroidota bacterium]TAG86052.1 MAG: hypothetical protein EAZ20_13600 [Bacteroidota bacterium]
MLSKQSVFKIFFLFFFSSLFILQTLKAQMQYKGAIGKVGGGWYEKGVFVDGNVGLVWKERNPMRSIGSKNGMPERIFILSGGFELGYDLKKEIKVSPKIAAEYHFVNGLPLTFRVQNRYYPAAESNYKNGSWQICPEFGINFWGAKAFITYGYSMPVTNRLEAGFIGHQINFGWNFYRNR